MSIYTFVPVIFIVLYLGYWFYMKKKNSQQAQVVNNTGFIRNIQFLDRTNDTIIVAYYPVPNFELIDIVKCERVVGQCGYTVNVSVLSHSLWYLKMNQAMRNTVFVSMQ